MTPTSRPALAFALAASLLAAGCSLRVADLTLVSTKNIDLRDTRLEPHPDHAGAQRLISCFYVAVSAASSRE